MGTAWLGRWRRGLPALATAVVLLVGGCGVLDGAFEAPSTPRPCDTVYSDARCQAMADQAARQLGTTREDVLTVEIMPAPTPRTVNGTTILETRSGGMPIDVRVTLADGSTHLVTMPCGGISSHPACQDEPRLQVSSPVQGGYRDVPEGASPVPPADPEAIAAAVALRIDRLDIPIDHVGPFEVILGEASLPNGLLTTTDFALVDEWPAGVTIIEGVVSMEVRSLVDGTRLWNIYAHGWREGTEPVEAILRFEVFRFEPGAVLSIRDVLVR